jgi:hypothetical protein
VFPPVRLTETWLTAWEAAGARVRSPSAMVVAKPILRVILRSLVEMPSRRLSQESRLNVKALAVLYGDRCFHAKRIAAFRPKQLLPQPGGFEGICHLVELVNTRDLALAQCVDLVVALDTRPKRG